MNCKVNNKMMIVINAENALFGVNFILASLMYCRKGYIREKKAVSKGSLQNFRVDGTP